MTDKDLSKVTTEELLAELRTREDRPVPHTKKPKKAKFGVPEPAKPKHPDPLPNRNRDVKLFAIPFYTFSKLTLSSMLERAQKEWSQHADSYMLINKPTLTSEDVHLELSCDSHYDGSYDTATSILSCVATYTAPDDVWDKVLENNRQELLRYQTALAEWRVTKAQWELDLAQFKAAQAVKPQE